MYTLYKIVSLIFIGLFFVTILDLLSIGITLLDIFPYQTRGTEWYKLTNKELFDRFLQDLLFIGLALLFVGISFLISYLLKKYTNINLGEPKKIEFTKCPNCKEVFNYNELTNGKCKNCKDVDTIDLDEYFEKYPEELEEKD